MSIYLLQLIGKWFNILIITIASLSGNLVINQKTFTVNSYSNIVNYNTSSRVQEHDTIVEYNSKLPKNINKVKKQGIDGLYSIDKETQAEQVIRPMVSEILEVGTGPEGEFVGMMTGYGPDCPGCSSVGNVACHTREKTNHSLTYDGIYYTDTEYGKLRILAADFTLFRCGTIIKVDTVDGEPFYGIVLDTGSAMVRAWRQRNTVLIDLAFDSQNSAKSATRKNTQYSVQRWGW